MLCFRNAKETIFVSRVKYTFALTRDCKSCSPARQLNSHIFVTSTQSRHFFFFYRELFSQVDCSPCSPKKPFFFNKRNRIEHLFAARVVATVQMVALLYKSSTIIHNKKASNEFFFFRTMYLKLRIRYKQYP